MSLSKYTPEETAALREQVLKQRVEPLVQQWFDKTPPLRSATLMLAQFWDDEADDAVHARLVLSERDTPDVEAASRADGADPVNLPHAIDEDTWYALFDAYVHHWPSNGDAIPLFAAFTREGCHQDMTLAEAYTPYAHFRRTPQGFTTEVVGTMLRPWLEGVRPSWEMG
ncbi:hypothetical protein POL68_29200 [Stigmatella sp. ncwal1]|uniref:Uncharacterized protein n=1 Tax=Stigmatella ashevillensis TaxID=2995309 RepID=A0ABT5DJN9_9BACT|nr:hypothetical protein [Stigmatella ashevillena]MDC0712576.1 hypothetical protein [Stigmatella ashevillena]